MNPLLATFLTLVVGLMAIAMWLAWAVAWSIAVIWSINILGGSLQFDWQTVIAIIIIAQVIGGLLRFAGPTRKQRSKK